MAANFYAITDTIEESSVCTIPPSALRAATSLCTREAEFALVIGGFHKLLQGRLLGAFSML
ncbi:MAG: hypothetical protein IJN21_03410, partial [Clostridia bacterium]|nr:hypothetical protein [Clostridia bacterium]